MYSAKFIRDNVIAPFLQLSVVIVTLPLYTDLYYCCGRNGKFV